jgi:glycosyltransferase involved in cell wall biosynthesis
MGGIYENLLLSLLDKNAECIYAASDSISIQDFKLKHNSILKKEIISLPTRFDEVIFSPREMKSTREKLNLPQNKTILVTTGRLCWVKGWDLLLEVIKNRNEIDQALLIFVGDGEDRKQIEEKYPGLINNTILITGFVDSQTVSDYINSADVFILGSYTEGWSTSLIEALACGKPIVTTNVSSAFDIVNEGVNGFIVKERSHSIFNKRISDALELKDVVVASGQMALKFKKSTLYEDFTKNWEAGKILFQ